METVSREQVNYRQVRGEEMGTEDCEAKGTDAGGRRGEDVHLLRVRRAADTGSQMYGLRRSVLSVRYAVKRDGFRLSVKQSDSGVE